MKKPTILILSFILFVHVTLAQDYKLTFTLQGEVNTIDSVMVENATKNTSVKLNGNDTLVLTKMVNANEYLHSESFQLKAFPNPSESIFTLQFITNKPEQIFAAVFDTRGSELISKKWFVNQGNHFFKLKNLPAGIFLVQINSANYAEKLKIISLQNNSSHPEISALQSSHTTDKINLTKSATSAQLLGYEQYDNIVVRVWPTQAPWELTRGFVMEPEPPEDQIVITYRKCEDYCGNVYNTVELGDQIWMAENFRCATENSWVYDDNANNAGTFGRLYTWEDAVNNAPVGWHLPTSEEWNKMQQYVQNTYEENLPVALKSKSGWISGEQPANGTDASGFNMVPSGARWFVDGTYYAKGERAYFWTSSKTDSIRASIRKFTSSDTEIGSGSSNIDYGFSVRYVKDAVEYGTFTDDRDGENYKTITIGEQTWMAENMRYGDTPVTDDQAWQDLKFTYFVYLGGYCWYDNDENNKYKYGVLYNITAAANACPVGWHLPTDTEWTKLTDYLEKNDYGYNGNESYIAKPLSSTTSWNTSNGFGDPGNEPGNNNSTGFSGLAGGHRSIYGGYIGEGNFGKWWSSTERDNNLPEDLEYWIRELNYTSTGLIRSWREANWGCYVRCIKD